MFEGLREFVMEWLDPLAVVVGLLIAIPVFWTWYEVTIGSRRRQRRWFLEIRKQHGTRPSVLILDLLVDKNMQPVVENYLQRGDALKAVPRDRVFRIEREKKLGPDDMPALAAEIRRRAADILSAGTDVLHVFHAGPASVAALVGAEFANSCRVLIYQHDHGDYINFGPLRIE